MPAYGSFTDYAESKILNWLFGGVPLPPPPYWYFGYVVSPAGEEGASVEINSAGYSRISVGNTTQEFAVTANQLKTNTEEILYSRATASHGIVQAIAIYDSPASGNMWIYAPLDQPIVIDANDSFRIDPGGFSFGFEVGGWSNFLKNAVLNHLFGAVPYNPPAAYHLAWASTTPTDAAPGTEPSTGTGYGRIATANNTNAFPPITPGGDGKALALTSNFAVATADQGTATHLQLFDAATGGNHIAYGLLGTPNNPRPKIISTDTIFTVLPGDFRLGLN